MSEHKGPFKSASGVESEIADLRRMVTDMGESLGRQGQKRLSRFEAGLADASGEFADEGRKALHEINRRLGRLERRVTHSVRDHPGEWAAGTAIAVLGIGLAVVLLMRANRGGH